MTGRQEQRRRTAPQEQRPTAPQEQRPTAPQEQRPSAAREQGHRTAPQEQHLTAAARGQGRRAAPQEQHLTAARGQGYRAAPRVQLLLLAKTPVPGRVKTRLCPPCTPAQAAGIAAAMLADTVDVLTAAPAARRTLVVDGDLAAPPGWHRRPQRGGGLGERLAAAYADTALDGVATLLVGMDTPQLRVGHIVAACAALTTADAVLGPAADGGWWALGLRDPAVARVLAGVPMSTSDTGSATLAALDGLEVAALPVLRDVDTAGDAWTVAADCPHGRFARSVAACMSAPPETAETAAPVEVRS